MNKDDLPESSQGIEKASSGLREVFESLRTILVASIAAVISLVGWLSTRFSTWQRNAEEKSKLLELEQAEKQSKIDQERRAEEQAIREEKRKAEQQAKIEEERRAEERAIREEERAIKDAERKQREKKLGIKQVIYPALSTMSTISLIAGVAMLVPIAEWTRSQNECIAQSSGQEEFNPDDFANKVMRCNGGHE